VRTIEGATSVIYQGAAEPKADPVKQQASRSTRIELEPIGLTEHGRRYRVTYAGETLVEGRRNPIFDACRALLARGITGRLEVWRRGKTIADMQLDIERDARLAILETATETLRVVPWRPREPRSDITSPNAVSRRSLQPPGGDLHVAGRVAYPGADAGSRSRIGTRQMSVESDGWLAVITEERPATTEHPLADRTSETPEPSGQMFMIRKSVEALLAKRLTVAHAQADPGVRRITDHLQGTGIRALEMPHRSSYNRFRKTYGSKYGLR
jgi:hypothetical protein